MEKISEEQKSLEKNSAEVTDIDYFIVSEIEKQLKIKISDLDEVELDEIMARCTLIVKQPLKVGKKPKYQLRIK